MRVTTFACGDSMHARDVVVTDMQQSWNVAGNGHRNVPVGATFPRAAAAADAPATGASVTQLVLLLFDHPLKLSRHLRAAVSAMHLTTASILSASKPLVCIVKSANMTQ